MHPGTGCLADDNDTRTRVGTHNGPRTQRKVPGTEGTGADIVQQVLHTAGGGGKNEFRTHTTPTRFVCCMTIPFDFTELAGAFVSPVRNGLYLSLSMDLFDFVGSARGTWHVTRQSAVVGASIALFPALTIAEGTLTSQPPANWLIKGVRSNMRYTHQAEAKALVSQQAPLGRAAATCAALIPIKKSDAWWALAQDERRSLFEEQSRHIAIGMDYLPAIARRLYHSRDLGQEFDFLTWFEFAPEHTQRFDNLLVALRNTAEWTHVVREVDIRLVKSQPQS